MQYKDQSFCFSSRDSEKYFLNKFDVIFLNISNKYIKYIKGINISCNCSKQLTFYSNFNLKEFNLDREN